MKRIRAGKRQRRRDHKLERRVFHAVLQECNSISAFQGIVNKTTVFIISLPTDLTSYVYCLVIRVVKLDMHHSAKYRVHSA
jgi:hypothetical protein